MYSPTPINPSSIKTQAKKLRAELEAKGVQATHSECLETLAHIYGYKDWNTFRASIDEPTKQYIMYCSATGKSSYSGEPETTFFSVLVMAKSLDEAIERCKQVCAGLHLRENSPFQGGKKIFLEDMVECISIPDDGLILDYRSFLGDYSSIYNPTPLGTDSRYINAFTTSEEDEKSEGYITDDDREPFVVLGN